jgi:hypothetical protein
MLAAVKHSQHLGAQETPRGHVLLAISRSVVRDRR